MDLITSVFVIISAYYLGKTLIAYMNYRGEVKQSNHKQVIAYLDGIIRQVKIETYNGVKYWFDDENDKFLAQGITNEEIYSVIKERFPDTVFLLPEGSVLCAPEWVPVTSDRKTLSNKIINRHFK